MKWKNVVIEAIKKAEDSDEIIIRVYECYNRRTNAKLTSYKPILKAAECNLLERELKEISTEGNSFLFDINPYEIKTFKLKV